MTIGLTDRNSEDPDRDVNRDSHRLSHVRRQPAYYLVSGHRIG
jgi:hypothetical protein